MNRAFLAWLCVASAILVNTADATVYYWDPEQANTPTAANLAGTWDTTSSQWSSLQVQTNAPIAWVSGYAADFSAGSTTVTTPYIVNVNSTIPIGGIFNGLGITTGSFINLNGSGALNLVSGADAFYANGSDGGTITINVPMVGTGEVALEGGNKIYFDATNTFSGGTSFGYTGVTAFSSVLVISNGYALGTGPIIMNANGAGSTLAAAGPTPITVTNAFTVASVVLNITPNAAGLTLSGPWPLTTTPLIGVSNNVLNISGKMSGTGGFTKFGAGTVMLSGANTYTGFTTVSNGILSITADNNLGAAPGVANYDLLLSGGTLTASNSFLLNSNRLISLTANSTINVASSKTLTYFGTIGGTSSWTKAGNGTLALNGVSGFSGTTTISAGTLEADCQSGSTTSTNVVNLSSGGTLSGQGLVAGYVSGNGKIAPGTQAGPANLLLDNGLNLSTGGTYVWNLTNNSMTNGFSTISLNAGNLSLGGSSKLSISLTGTATQPSTNDPFWLAPEEWAIIVLNGVAGNSNATSFASIINGSYTAGVFTNYHTASGLTLLYKPNFAYFGALSDGGFGLLSGENVILTNISGLNLYVWSSTNAALPVNSWTLEGPMSEQSLSPAQPGYSLYSFNVNPIVSPTYYIAGNMNTGPYLASSVNVGVVTTEDFANFDVENTNVAINAVGRLGLIPFPPVMGAGSFDQANGYQVQFSAQTNVNYVIQSSPDLVTWTNMSSGTITSSPVMYLDSDSTNYGLRYYRVVIP